MSASETEMIGAIAARLGLFLSGCLCIAILLGFSRLLKGPWWATVLFQHSQRPKAVAPAMWGSLAVVEFAFIMIAGTSGLGIGLILWALLSPQWITRRASKRAWLSDSEAERSSALEVRNRRRELMSEPPLTGERAWDEYIIDAAKAVRQRAYQEQFYLSGGEDDVEAAKVHLGFHVDA